MKLPLGQLRLASETAAGASLAGDVGQRRGSPALGAPHPCLRAVGGPPPGSSEFRCRMAAVGDSLRAGGVGAIVLVDSEFVAVDVRDFLLALGRRWPAGSFISRQLAAQVIDHRSHDAGGYTPRFAELLERSLGRGIDALPVKLVHWSGENHHLGRADAAVRLLDELAAFDLPPGQRVMLWGRGQAGNVLALLLRLLAADAAAVERFFAAARIYYRLPATGVVDVPVWQRAWQLLTRYSDRLAHRAFDVVTFGTPPRYNWLHRPSDRLLHFVHHRPSTGVVGHLARLPLHIDDLREASGGDYIQQLAVTGTETPPSRFAWRSWLADRRLGDLLEVRDGQSSVAERLACGRRLPDAGATLLVDYGPPSGAVSEHLAGHAVYTWREWLLFHAEQVAQRLGNQARSSAHAA